MNIEEVKRIIVASKKERWLYPKTFQALIGAGVTSYRTDLADGRTVYRGDNESCEDIHSLSSPNLTVADRFRADEVRRGLDHHQRNQTPYADFLRDMAAAGVSSYEVDMAERVITYTSGRPGEIYREAVPGLE